MAAALSVEWLKLRRSRLWWITMLAITAAALAGGMFMFIGQNPDRARALGLLGAKSQLAGIPANWTGHCGLLAQIIAVGGAFIFGILTIWMFGREYSDRTMKDLLALPTSRTAIISAKFLVIAAWSLTLTGYAYVISLATGALLRLPGWSLSMAGHGLLRLLITASMTIGLSTVLALAASIGRGYLAAVGTLIVTVVLAQIIAAIGYGQYFPWSVPALFSGIAGPDASSLSAFSFVSIAAVAAAAIASTVVWVNRADQTD